MIEKLKRPVKIGGTTFREKINELVDAVNNLQESYDNVCIWVGEQKLKNNTAEPADPYAEQKKWIGKLCWFWNDDLKQCGILTAVFDNNKYGKDDSTKEYPFQRDSIGCWQHCEPVSPDDDIIYKKD